MKLGFDATEVIAEVANTITRDARSPKAGHQPGTAPVSAPGPGPARLAEANFPFHPLARPDGAGLAATCQVPRPQASAPRRSARTI